MHTHFPSKRHSVLLVFGSILGALIFVMIWGQVYPLPEGNSDEVMGATFSSTAQWGEEFIALANRPLTTEIVYENLVLPPPPENGSLHTRRELGALLALRNLRTEEMRETIEAEINMETATFDGVSMRDYLNSALHPETAPVLNYAWQDVGTIIMLQKAYFNRVRPHMLRSDIAPLIDIPPHPAYPSGHSTQAHFLAEVLSAINPLEREAYFARADEIAWHREVAGVHYASDSEAGRMLASQIFNALQSDPEFVRLLEEGRKTFESLRIQGE